MSRYKEFKVALANIYQYPKYQLPLVGFSCSIVNTTNYYCIGDEAKTKQYSTTESYAFWHIL